MRYTLIAIVLFVVLLACGNIENNRLIVGKWQGAQWIINGQPSPQMALATYFEFDSTGNYSYSFGNNKEKGTYKVANDELYTKPANEAEMMVRIKKLNADSLIFEMNRGGTPEELTLLRVKL